jgi:hypothetical protein
MAMPDEPKCLDVPAFRAVGDGYGANKEDAYFDARNDAQSNATTFCKQHEGCEKERYCMGDLVKLKKIETIPGKAGEKEKVGIRLIYEAKCGCFRDL